MGVCRCLPQFNPLTNCGKSYFADFGAEFPISQGIVLFIFSALAVGFAAEAYHAKNKSRMQILHCIMLMSCLVRILIVSGVTAERPYGLVGKKFHFFLQTFSYNFLMISFTLLAVVWVHLVKVRDGSADRRR